jgi:hypothetical protein
VDECEDERTGRGLGWDALDAGRAPGSGQGTCHHFCPLWPVIYNPCDLPWINTFIRLVPMANPESSDSPQVKLIHEWARGFRTRDLDAIASTLHKDYRYVGYPKSLGKKEETKEEWLERFGKWLSLWTANEPGVSYIGCSLDPLRCD